MKEPGLHFKDAQGWWRSFRETYGYLRAVPKKRRDPRPESELEMFRQIITDTMLFQNKSKRYVIGGLFFWLCLIAIIGCVVKIFALWKSLNALQP